MKHSIQKGVSFGSPVCVLACARPDCEQRSGRRAGKLRTGRPLFLIGLIVSVGIVGIVHAANNYSASFAAANSEYLSVTDGSQTGLDFAAADFTFEAWVKIASQVGTDAQYTIIDKIGTGDGKGYLYRYEDISGTKYFRLLVYPDGTNVGIYASAATTLTPGTWYHTAVVWDESKKATQFYLDAVTNGNLTGGTYGVGDTTGDFLVGSHVGTEGYFDGLIDEVRIWNDVRFASEISDNYNNELIGTEAGLVGYWKMNEFSDGATSVTRFDETANHNDLTNHNGVLSSADVPFDDFNSDSSPGKRVERGAVPAIPATSAVPGTRGERAIPATPATAAIPPQ